MKKNLIGAVLVFGFASSALAAPGGDLESTGKVTITAKVTNSVSMSFDSGDGSGSTEDGTLDQTIDFDDVAANATETSLVTKTVAFRLRSNVDYVLKADADVTGTTAAGDLGLADIGFGISEISPATTGTGSLVLNAHETDALGDFASDPSDADDSTGEVTFLKTLADVETETDIASGLRISKGGNVKSPNNFIKVETKYSILPQFFTETAAFEAVVNFTLAANP